MVSPLPPLTHDYTRSAAVATNMIYKWGEAASLRRNGMADRPCIAFIREYNAVERVGKVVDPTDRMVLVATSSALNAAPPNRDLDRLVTYVQPPTNPPVESGQLRITAPVVPFAPNGTVLYWKLAVRL
jgi:hypothetical protein